jgi:hypothetical protein
MSDSEQEILERFSTPGLRRNMLTRADKKAGLEIEPAAKAEPEAQRAIADDISGQVVSLTNARLIRNGEEAMARYEKTSGEIRMGVLKMVRGIIAAKNIYGSQLAFNKWFVTTEYWNVEKSARAALVELADYPAQELLQFLGETDLASPQEILTALRQKSTSQIVSTIRPPPDDPFFALAPELKLRLSELDGVLVTSSREVARVFFHDNHQQLIRHIMWSIWNDPMQPNYHDEFRQHPDGTVDITSRGLLEALNHWGFEYEETERHREFTHAAPSTPAGSRSTAPT